MIGTNLRKFREARNLTQAKLAREADMSDDYISKIELGKVRNVGTDTLKRIATALNVPVTDFFTDSSPVEACHE